MNKSFLEENVLEILDFLDEGIHIVDKNGINVYYNHAAERFDGVDRAQVEGKHVLLIYPSLNAETSTLLTTLRTGKQIVKEEQVFLNYLGKKITTENKTYPIKENGIITGAMEISRDITDMRAMSDTIVQLTEKLYKSGKKNIKQESTVKYGVTDIIGESEIMNRVKAMILKAASVDVSVLVSGDTGTGKELVVQSIHNASSRRTRPFIAQNCAAIPESLLEGILFGTVKGSFTGAENRAGLFELADGGTLFLDEINSMPLDLQAKLLRVIQDRNIRRVGSDKTINVDVRIMTALNINPEVAIERKELRRDLFYRLNILNIELPKLSERKTDIPVLSKHFVNKFNDKFNKNIKNITPEAMTVLTNYEWDGNVRELENLLEGIISISDKERIEVADLPFKLQNYNSPLQYGDTLSEIIEATERNVIIKALAKANGNISKAAKSLGVPRQTLQYKLKKYGVKV